MEGEAIGHSGENLHPDKPLPLFRPEALATNERFYGEVLLNHPLSSRVLAWLAVGMSAATCCVFFFVSYTETVRLHGVVLSLREAGRSRVASPALEALVNRGNSQGVILRPGMHLTLRCSTCSSRVPEIAVTMQRAVNVLPGGASNREMVTATLSSREFASSLNKQWLRPGAGVELVILVGRRQLLPWLFEPSRERGRSQ